MKTLFAFLFTGLIFLSVVGAVVAAVAFALFRMFVIHGPGVM